MNNVVIITRDQCDYCVAAKKLLAENDCPFTEKAIGRDIDREEVLVAFPGQRLLPVVVIDDQCIGGFEELRAWINNNGKRNAV